MAVTLVTVVESLTAASECAIMASGNFLFPPATLYTSSDPDTKATKLENAERRKKTRLQKTSRDARGRKDQTVDLPPLIIDIPHQGDEQEVVEISLDVTVIKEVIRAN